MIPLTSCRGSSKIVGMDYESGMNQGWPDERKRAFIWATHQGGDPPLFIDKSEVNDGTPPSALYEALSPWIQLDASEIQSPGFYLSAADLIPE